MAIQQIPLAGMESFERPQLNTPMDLLRLAIENNTAIDVIERLAALQREERDYRAKSAYFAAFTEFKRQLPRIEKTRKILDKDKKVRSMYAALEDICAAVVPILFNLGITHRYKTRTEPDGRSTVTCFLRHVDGYEEEGATMSAAPDTSGSKNAIQADGSTTAYLERYTFVASLGLPLYGQDTDGNRQQETSGEGLDEKTFVMLIERIEGATDRKQLEDAFFGALGEAGKVGDKAAIGSFNKAKNEWFRQNAGAK